MTPLLTLLLVQLLPTHSPGNYQNSYLKIALNNHCLQPIQFSSYDHYRLLSTKNISAKISECTPSYCTVYVISKGNLAMVRSGEGEPPVRKIKEKDTVSETNSNHSSSNILPSSLTGFINPQLKLFLQKKNRFKYIFQGFAVWHLFKMWQILLGVEIILSILLLCHLRGFKSCDRMYQSLTDRMYRIRSDQMFLRVLAINGSKRKFIVVIILQQIL